VLRTNIQFAWPSADLVPNTLYLPRTKRFSIAESPKFQKSSEEDIYDYIDLNQEILGHLDEI